MWASLGDGEANGIRIGTWAKVEMEKLLKLSISSVKDNFPGLLLDLKKKKKNQPPQEGFRVLTVTFRQEDSNYKVTRTTIKPQCQAQTKPHDLKDFWDHTMTRLVCSGSHSVWKTSELKFLKAIWNLGYTFLLNSSLPVFGFVFKVVGPANPAPKAPEKHVEF